MRSRLLSAHLEGKMRLLGRGVGLAPNLASNLSLLHNRTSFAVKCMAERGAIDCYAFFEV
jgi:hypothetical protein